MDAIVLCGGFGSYLHPGSAERIGLIPPGFAGKAVAIGNAAGNGAGQILQSAHKRDEAARTVARMETVELASNPLFQRALHRRDALLSAAANGKRAAAQGAAPRQTGNARGAASGWDAAPLFQPKERPAPSAAPRAHGCGGSPASSSG